VPRATGGNPTTFSPPINLPFTAYGKAVKARDRLREGISQHKSAEHHSELHIAQTQIMPQVDRRDRDVAAVEVRHRGDAKRQENHHPAHARPVRRGVLSG